MELDATNTTTIFYYITNPNESKEIQPDVERVKTEAPEADDRIKWALLEHEDRTIQSDRPSTPAKLKYESFSTPEAEVINNSWLEIKSENLSQELHLESIKQELLHEELDIKSEDEMIQEPCLIDENYNSQIQLPKNITNKKSFKCSICDNSFSHKCNLHTHLRTHTGEKPFKCNICDNSFSQKCNFQTHLRTHTGEQPFKCIICDNSFSQKCNLQTHLRIHTGEKPFKCNICDKSFTNKRNFERHLRNHTGEKSFKCSICNNIFKCKTGLNVHIARTHSRVRPPKK